MIVNGELQINLKQSGLGLLKCTVPTFVWSEREKHIEHHPSRNDKNKKCKMGGTCSAHGREERMSSKVS